MILDVLNALNPPPDQASCPDRTGPELIPPGSEYCLPSSVLLAAEKPDSSACRRLRKIVAQHYRVLGVPAFQRVAEIALRTSPDVILIDAAGERTCGFSVFKDLRDHPDTRRIPILAIAGARQKQSGLTVLSAGANDILFRPFAVGELVLRLSQLVALSETQKHLLEAMSQLHATEVKWRESARSATQGMIAGSILQELSQPLARLAQALPEMQGFATSLPAERTADFTSRLQHLQQNLALARALMSDSRLLPKAVTRFREHHSRPPGSPNHHPDHGARAKR